MSQKKHGKFRFNDFEVDLARRTLRRGEHTVSVSTRTFDLLSFFVQNPRRVVTKEELMHALWPDAELEESNLGQHVFLLRKALTGTMSGDRLILTIPGRGYQFNAQVTQIEDASPKSAAASERPSLRLLQAISPAAGEGDEEAKPSRRAVFSFDADPPAESPIFAASAPSRHSAPEVENRAEPDAESNPESDPESALPKPSAPSRVLFIVAAGLLVILTAGAVWLGLRHWRPASRASLGLLIADFDNNTGNPQFDLSLQRAVDIDLRQSPFLSIPSEEAVRGTLADLRASASGPASQSIVREACRRLDDQAYLTGETHQFSRKFLVTLHIFDCATGKSIASTRGIADSPDAVLPILDRMTADLRRQLGEPSASIARFGKPLFAGRAPSLDALKAYSEARLLMLHGKSADSIPLLQRALELDSRFVLAFSDLGILYASSGESSIATDNLAKAYALRDTAGEFDRIDIVAAYDDLVTGDLQAAIRNQKEGMTLYPRNPVFPANLAGLEIQIGNAALAVEPAQHSLQFNPANASGYANLARAQMQLRQPEEAIATCRKAIAAHADGREVHAILLQLAFLNLDQPAIDEQLAWARNNDKDPAAEPYMRLQQALMDFAEGKAKAAQAIFSALAAEDRSHGQTERADRLMSLVPRMDAELGLVEGAHALLDHLPESLVGADADAVSADIPVAWAEAGENSRAQAMLQHALDTHATGTLWQQDFGPQVRAAIALNRVQPEEAVQALASSTAFDLRSFALAGMRGRAYLAAKQPAQAEAEFRKIIDHPGIEPLSYNYPLAYLGLARALAQQGKTTDARAAYSLLFNIWKEADPDLPRLTAAKTEYAKLNGSAPRSVSAPKTGPASKTSSATKSSSSSKSSSASSKPAASKPRHK